MKLKYLSNFLSSVLEAAIGVWEVLVGLAWNVDPSNFLSSIFGVVAGFAITWFFYGRATADLKKVTKELRGDIQLVTELVEIMAKGDVLVLKRDENGKPVGYNRIVTPGTGELVLQGPPPKVHTNGSE